MSLPLRVEATGLHLPPRVETAEDLAPRVGRSAEWILSRTGVAERRITERPMDEMAADAARQALGDGPPPDLLLNASLTPLQLIPDSSVFILDQLGLAGTPSFSIHATCLSFLAALHCASGLLASGVHQRILVVSAEQGSLCRNLDEPESAVLIGDGAGAALLTRSGEDQGSALLAFRMGTWPEGANLTEIRGAGTRNHPNAPHTQPDDNLFHMKGQRIYRLAFRRVAKLLQRLLEEAGIAREDIDLVVPHQASGPALSALKRLGFSDAQVVDHVAEVGNCIAASIPMALATANQQGRLRRGDTVLLIGTGAGLSVAGALLRW